MMVGGWKLVTELLIPIWGCFEHKTIGNAQDHAVACFMSCALNHEL